ncbi:MAG: amidohydrolase family protein [Planctomycetota bacterium]
MTLGARSALVVLAAAAASVSAQRPADSTAPLLIRADRFLTMAGPTLHDGAMLIRDGKIVAIGAGAQIDAPPGAEVLDLGRRTVTPGFVDLHHHVSSGGGDINDMVLPTNPELRTLDTVRPSARVIRETLSGGVTTTLFIPGSGTNLSGFGALLKMAGDTLEEMVIRELGAMKVAQGFNPERRSGDLGASRMGMHLLLTETLERGRDYAQAWRDHRAGQGPQPDLDPRLEQLRAVFDGKVPVLIHTAGARDCVATARMFQDVFGVWMILSHGTFDGWWAATALAARGTPVNLGPRTYDFDRDGHFQGIAAGYWDSGCTDLSINTDAPVIAGEQLQVQAAMAARLGLPTQAALQAVTIQPARQIGLGDRVGSLEPGKDADFIVTRGDPLDPRNPPELVFIEGEIVYRAGDVP